MYIMYVDIHPSIFVTTYPLEGHGVHDYIFLQFMKKPSTIQMMIHRNPVCVC